MPLTPEVIDAAVAFWGAAVLVPTFRQLSDEERRFDPQAARNEAFGAVLMAALQARTPVTENQRGVFTRELRKVLDGSSDLEVTLNGETTPVSIYRVFAAGHDAAVLSVDYGPDWVLGACAKRAGIPDYHFPIKTVMWLRADRATVRHGYDAPVRVLEPNGTLGAVA